MGMLLIILGTASVGLLADFVIENHLGSAPMESFALFGSSFKMSIPALVLVAFVAGMLTLMLVKTGMSLVRDRRRRRRGLRRHLADLERENAELRTEHAEGTRPEMHSNGTLPAARAGSPTTIP